MSTEQRGLVPSLDPVSIAQKAVGFLYCQGMLLAHVQLAVFQDSHALFCRALSPSLSSSSYCPKWVLRS